MKPLHAQGLWHLPGSPSDVLVGTLDYSPEAGAILSLTGCFREEQADMQVLTRPAAAHPIIHGIVNESPFGRKLTLVDCTQTKHGISIPGFSTSEYRASTVYVGEHLLDKCDLVFSGIHVSLSGLASWIGATGIERRIVEDKGSISGVDVTYRRPDEVVVELDGGVELKFTFTWRLKESWPGRVSLREEPWIQVHAHTRQSLHQLRTTYVRPLQNLMSFATDAPNGIEQLVVLREELKGASGDDPAPFYVLSQPIITGEEMESRPTSGDMLFALADVREMIQELVTRWLRFVSTYKPFCDVYFAMQEAPARHIEIRFLLLVQAMSIYFGRMRSSRDEYRDLAVHMESAMSKVIRDADRRWVHAILPRVEDVLFPRALCNAVEENLEVMGPLVSSDPGGFVDKVFEIRGYLVHRHPDLRVPGAEGSKLHWLIEKLLILVKVCILRDIGFQQDKILALLNRNQRYLYLRSLQSADQ